MIKALNILFVCNCLLVATANSHDLLKKVTAVGVSEREFRVVSYRQILPLGLTKFNVENFGEDTHNFVVLANDNRVLAASGEIKPGSHISLKVRFKKAGSYRLVCTLANHRLLGMQTTVKVKSR